MKLSKPVFPYFFRSVSCSIWPSLTHKLHTSHIIFIQNFPKKLTKPIIWLPFLILSQIINSIQCFYLGSLNFHLNSFYFSFNSFFAVHFFLAALYLKKHQVIPSSKTQTSYGFQCTKAKLSRQLKRNDMIIYTHIISRSTKRRVWILHIIRISDDTTSRWQWMENEWNGSDAWKELGKFTVSINKDWMGTHCHRRYSFSMTIHEHEWLSRFLLFGSLRNILVKSCNPRKCVFVADILLKKLLISCTGKLWQKK